MATVGCTLGNCGERGTPEGAPEKPGCALLSLPTRSPAERLPCVELVSKRCSPPKSESHCQKPQSTTGSGQPPKHMSALGGSGGGTRGGLLRRGGAVVKENVGQMPRSLLGSPFEMSRISRECVVPWRDGGRGTTPGIGEAAATISIGGLKEKPSKPQSRWDSLTPTDFQGW